MCAILQDPMKDIKKWEAVTVSHFLFFISLSDLIEFQDSHEGTLRNLHSSDLTHPLLTLLLFL